MDSNCENPRAGNFVLQSLEVPFYRWEGGEGEGVVPGWCLVAAAAYPMCMRGGRDCEESGMATPTSTPPRLVLSGSVYSASNRSGFDSRGLLNPLAVCMKKMHCEEAKGIYIPKSYKSKSNQVCFNNLQFTN
jgi:hypothetical protein